MAPNQHHDDSLLLPIAADADSSFESSFNSSSCDDSFDSSTGDENRDLVDKDDFLGEDQDDEDGFHMSEELARIALEELGETKEVSVRFSSTYKARLETIAIGPQIHGLH